MRRAGRDDPTRLLRRHPPLNVGGGASPVFTIIAETAADVVGARGAARPRHGAGPQAQIVEKLRRGRKPSEGLAFVASAGQGRVVGTVRLWDVAVWRAAACAAAAARPARGRSIVEGRRHRLGADAACDRGGGPAWPSRDPAGRRRALLSRFGFSAEKTGSLAMPGPYERHRFLALELMAGALDGA